MPQYPGAAEHHGNLGKYHHQHNRAGQAFLDGIRFVQYYFGLPLAMIVIIIGRFVPVSAGLKCFTAYNFSKNVLM